MIQGTLNSNANTTFRIEFFASSRGRSHRLRRGFRLISGPWAASTDASGNASFNLSLNTPNLVGQVITTTATDPGGDTSEFSKAISVSGSQATFVKQDTTTQGTWKGAYGVDGYNISQDPSSNNPSLPSYATLTLAKRLGLCLEPLHHRRPAPLAEIRDRRDRPDRRHLVFLDKHVVRRPPHRRQGAPRSSSMRVDFDNHNRSETIQVIDDAHRHGCSTRERCRASRGGAYLVWVVQGKRHVQGHQCLRRQWP